MSDRLQHVTIVGGGVAAAMTALALARRIPRLLVTWVDTGVPQDSVEDVLGAARPSLSHFHRALGLEDVEFLRRTHCGRRWGTRVERWGAEPFFRSHDPLPAGLPGVPIHQLWLRLADDAQNRPDWIEIADAGADLPPPALLLDLDDYRAVLGMLAKSAGIRRIVSAAVHIEHAADQPGVAALHLPDGETIRADLFVDATGPSRLLHGKLPGGWVDWSSQLPTRRLRIERRSPAAEPVQYDRLTGRADGWCIEAYLPRATLSVTGSGDDSAGLDRSEKSTTEYVALAAGRLEAPFLGNVVALGSAAAVLDPIAATALHLLCRQIERLIAYWPGKDLHPAEVALYNRRSALDADRMRDFVQLHFIAGTHDTAFWQAPRTALSERLSSDLSLFRERGRLFAADEDGFETDEWISTLLGLGFRPAQRDALAHAVPIALARRQIMAAAARTNTHLSRKEELR